MYPSGSGLAELSRMIERDNWRSSSTKSIRLRRSAGRLPMSKTSTWRAGSSSKWA